MVKTVKVLESPPIIGRPSIEFKGDDFNALIWKRGLDVIIENAVKCPCKTRNNDHLSTCKNCLGTGWVFINPVEDRAVISSINSETKYKEWSEEKIGTVSISLQRRSYLSFMDKVTIKDSEVLYSEVLQPIVYNTNFFAYTIYSILDTVEVFRFVSGDVALQLLVKDTDYTIDDNKIIITTSNVADLTALKADTSYSNYKKTIVTGLDKIYEFDETSTTTPDDANVVKPDDILVENAGRWLLLENFSISVRYKHRLQYEIIDTPHTIRNNYKKDNQGREELQQLPIHGVGRLVHYVMDAPNFAGDNIIDNSYNT